MTDFQNLDSAGNISALYTTLGNLLTNYSFSIPVNQRQYVWKEPQIESLMRDLSGTGSSGNFFGQIILTHQGARYSIIDGQQRLTTFSLLAIAILNASHDESVRWSLSPKNREFLKSILGQGKKPRISGIQPFPYENDPGTEDPLAFLSAAPQGEFDERCDVLIAAGKDSPCYRLAINCRMMRNLLVGGTRSSRSGKASNFVTQEEFDTIFERAFSKISVLCVLFTQNALATSLFDGLNSKAVALSTDQILKNKFCSILGLDPRSGEPDVAGGNEFAKLWENLESRVLRCRKLFGPKFPTINEYLGILLALNFSNGGKVSLTERGIIQQFEIALTTRRGASREQQLKSAESNKRKAKELLHTASRSLEILQTKATAQNLEAGQIRYSLESLGMSLGAMYGFAIPLALIFRDGSGTEPKELAEACRLAEVATFRLFKTRAIGAGAYKVLMLNAASDAFSGQPWREIKAEMRKIAPNKSDDSSFQKFLISESFKDSKLAFYVVNRIGRTFSSDQKKYFVTDRENWEIEHIVPQKALRYWGFSAENTSSFSKDQLNRIGNLMVINRSINAHVQNRRLDFKVATPGLKPCSSSCALHYSSDSIYSNEIKKNPFWNALLGTSRAMSSTLGDCVVTFGRGRGSSEDRKRLAVRLFDQANIFVNKRAKFLAAHAIEKKIWEI